MSHFTVLVIGDDPEEQLAPFNENIRTEETDQGPVPEGEIQRFMTHYIEEHKKQLLSVPLKERTFEEFYAEHGEAWNGSRWKKHADGTWHEYSTYNPNSKWDWYSLGGRWTGFFKVKAMNLLGTSDQSYEMFMGFTGAEMKNFVEMYRTYPEKFKKVVSRYNGKAKALTEKVVEITNAQPLVMPEHKVGQPGLMTTPADEGYADQLLKKHIDFEGMRKEAEDRAAEAYDKAMKIFGDLPPQRTWEDIRENSKDKSRDEQRAEYWNQPRCVAWSNADMGFGSDPDNFLISREEYLLNARNDACITYAVLCKGTWIAKGEMGYFGISDDKVSEAEWGKQVNKLIDEQPDDTLFSLYDLHI